MFNFPQSPKSFQKMKSYVLSYSQTKLRASEVFPPTNIPTPHPDTHSNELAHTEAASTSTNPIPFGPTVIYIEINYRTKIFFLDKSNKMMRSAPRSCCDFYFKINQRWKKWKLYLNSIYIYQSSIEINLLWRAHLTYFDEYHHDKHTDSRMYSFTYREGVVSSVNPRLGKLSRSHATSDSMCEWEMRVW